MTLSEPVSCRLRDGDLLAYSDGYLPEGRRELVEAHLLACRHCRTRMATFREVDKIIQSAVTLVDNAAHRATIKARLAEEAPPRTRAWTLRRSLAVVPALAILLGLLAWPLGSQADFPLGKFIRFGPIAGERWTDDSGRQFRIDGVADGGNRDGQPTFQAVAPPLLPPDLALSERTRLEKDRLELLYRGTGEVEVLLAETTAREAVVSLQPSDDDRILPVRETDVYVLPDPREGMVSGLLWERKGVFFELLAVGRGGLEQTDAVRIVEALMSEQDAGEA